MAAINIGSTAVERGSDLDVKTYIAIDLASPASADGTITQIELWCGGAKDSIVVGTCYNVGGNDYTSRDYETINTIGAGYSTHVVDLTVVTGDFIFFGNCVEGAGNIYVDFDSSGGTGTYFKATAVPFTGVTFDSLDADGALSCYGTGATSGWAGGDIGEVPIANIAKINGVALADILKVNGVA